MGEFQDDLSLLEVNEENCFSNSNYRLFLKLLKKNSISTSRCVSKFYSYTHPRRWIPPPCLTSSAQKNHVTRKKQFHRTHSYPNIYESLSSNEMEKKRKPSARRSKMTLKKPSAASVEEQEDEIGDKLKQLRKERELLKEAQLMVELGESLSPSIRALVHKWKNFFAESQRQESAHEEHARNSKISSGAEGHYPSKKTERMLRNLEESFQQAKEEEEKLEEELKSLRKEVSKTKGSKKPSVKLKKSSHDYKYLAVKRKYEDLRHYLRQNEREKKELRKENEVLHSALKEQDQSPLKKKIEYLERQILTRNAHIKECEEQIKNSYNIHEENSHLKTLIQELRRKLEEAQQRSTHEEEKTKDSEKEGFEDEWLEKLNRTKALYEKAIQGYKEELKAAQAMQKALEKRLESVMKHYEEKEQQLVHDYESRIKTLKLEGFCEVFSEDKDASEKEKKDNQDDEISVLSLEKIIHDQEREIEDLKNALQRTTEQSMIHHEQIWKKMEELAEKHTDTSSDNTLYTCLKETLRKCFEELKENEEEKGRESIFPLHKEKENLIEILREKTNELASTKKELEEAKKQNEHLSSKCEFFESKACHSEEMGQNLEALKDLPHFLKENQNKLSSLQAECQNGLTENKVLQERLKSHASELQAKNERIIDLEERIRELNSVSRKWEREAEALEAKVDLLKVQVEKKNAILEKNSAQLEERIRENSTIAAQLERQRDDHNREVTSLKALNTDSQIGARLRDLETQNARFETQLTTLRTEKSNCEKTCRKQVRSMEEQISHLKIKNATLQKHLETIQATYKTMFPMEGISMWPHSLVDLPANLEPLFESRNPVE